MSSRKRRQFTADQKVAILREHLLENKPISEVCEAHDLQPSVFYSWQRRFFENGAAAFSQQQGAETRQLQQRVERLTQRLAQKDHVIARVTGELVHTKKANGEP